MTLLPFLPCCGVLASGWWALRPPHPPPTSFFPCSLHCEVMGIYSKTDIHQTARAMPDHCPCDRKPWGGRQPGDLAQPQSRQGAAAASAPSRMQPHAGAQWSQGALGSAGLLAG